jgi:hypothetical protein
LDERPGTLRCIALPHRRLASRAQGTPGLLCRDQDIAAKAQAKVTVALGAPSPFTDEVIE